MSKEKNPFVLSLKELRDEYYSSGDFLVDGKLYSMDQMIEEVENGTTVGVEFQKNIYKMVMTYMMKFGGDEEDHKK